MDERCDPVTAGASRALLQLCGEVLLTAPPTRQPGIVRAGASVGHVENRQGASPVTAVHTGVLAEWLAQPGDPVAPGQPLARLHPTGADV